MLNKKIKKLRLQKLLTQDELAKSLNISPSAISMYETGAREPDLNTLVNIAKFFNVTTDYLLGLSPNLYVDIKEFDGDPSNNYISELLNSIDKLTDILKKIQQNFIQSNNENKNS